MSLDGLANCDVFPLIQLESRVESVPTEEVIYGHSNAHVVLTSLTY